MAHCPETRMGKTQLGQGWPTSTTQRLAPPLSLSAASWACSLAAVVFWMVAGAAEDGRTWPAQYGGGHLLTLRAIGVADWHILAVHPICRARL
jgi:hypothetical protein